jgi:hypothetical protein
LDSNTTAQYNTALVTVGRGEDVVVESLSASPRGFDSFSPSKENGIE